jgi:hypothetical protein
MLKTIVSQLAEELENNGVEQVYTCFDNIPIWDKTSGIFTVVGIEGFESSAPIYSEYCVYVPFKAEAAITLLASQSTAMSQLYTFFDEKIFPIVKSMGSMDCALKNLTMKNDSAINRITLKIKFSVSGISRIERGN